MRGIKALETKLSASRQNLNKLPWFGFDWSVNESADFDKFSINNKAITLEKLEEVGESIIEYSAEKAGYVGPGGSFAGPFVFSFKNPFDILRFMRGMRINMSVYVEFGNIALKSKLQ